jgi:hypothetical protein
MLGACRAFPVFREGAMRYEEDDMANARKTIHKATRRSLLDADPPRHLRDDIDTLIPHSGLSARQVADMVLPREDRLWILLFACGLPDRLCLVFARICALRCLPFWLIPHPGVVVRYLRTGKKVLAREARGFLLPILGDAERAATWAATVPFFEGDSLDMVLRRWTRVSAPYRAWAAAASARKAGISGEDQIADLLFVMDTHPTVLSLRISGRHFDALPTGEA